jgi:hypothetical protein
MKQNQTIETQLDCRATASLQEQIDSDLRHEDRSIASLLSEEKDNDESKDSD